MSARDMNRALLVEMGLDAAGADWVMLEVERLRAIIRPSRTEDPPPAFLKLARELGALFGGNGLSHDAQTVLVAVRLEELHFHLDPRRRVQKSLDVGDGYTRPAPSTIAIPGPVSPAGV